MSAKGAEPKTIPTNKLTDKLTFYSNKTHSNKTIMTKFTIRFSQISDYNLVNDRSAKEMRTNSICARRQTWLRKRKFDTTKIIYA